MAAGERITIQMSGGGPWGFRLYGGDDEPLVVAKMRKRSKAFEAGLTEGDALLGINGSSCQGMSHSGAMGLIETTQDLNLSILRGASEKYAVNAAIQALGAELRPVASSVLNITPQAPTASPRLSPAPCRSAKTPSPAPAQAQQQVVNGYGAAPQYHREQQTYREGDTTTHVTTETSQQQVGGTTVTKVKRETHTQFGQGQKPMFNVSNLASSIPANDFRQVPGTWTPSGAPSAAPTKLKISAPSGVQVQENPDQSVTMTIGFHGQPDEAAKENIAPKQPEPPLFHVSKYGTQKQEAPKPKPALWTPNEPAARPAPRQDDTMDESSHYPLLPEEEAHITAHLESLKNPLPPHLQRVVFSTSLSGSDREGTPDSPGYLTRRRIEEFAESEDDSHKRKMFADSAFYDDPQHKYPTIEEQVKMARKVALSLLAPANKKARGHRMFMRRMVKSQKWTTDEERRERDFEWGDEEEEEKYYQPDPWAVATTTWVPPKAEPAPRKLAIPPPPPVPTNVFQMPTLPSGPRKEEKAKALSADEFEKMRLFEKKTDHTQVSPAMCFSLAEDLRNMKGRGGKLFAKRVARAEKWAEDEGSTVSKPANQDLIQKIAMQAAAGGSKAPIAMPGMVPAFSAPSSAPDGPPAGAAKQDDGPVVNRLKSMIDPPKPKMTPWDAAASHDGNTDEAFEHLKGYNPYGKSTQGEIATNLDQAIKTSNMGPTIAPMKHLPTSGQPAKLPEFTRKIKPWGSADQGSTAAAAAPVHRPAAAPASSSGAGFRSVGFRAPQGGASQPREAASMSPSGGGASYGGEEVGFCDL